MSYASQALRKYIMSYVTRHELRRAYFLSFVGSLAHGLALMDALTCMVLLMVLQKRHVKINKLFKLKLLSLSLSLIISLRSCLIRRLETPEFLLKLPLSPW